ncbi:hypothetical protein AB0J35_43580 [Nonomuraea angiospora]|uniref:hypothetical protein n=1 Tax=Nonomuraea angiospora TaxID=46172 RepID=UPI003429D2D2
MAAIVWAEAGTLWREEMDIDGLKARSEEIHRPGRGRTFGLLMMVMVTAAGQPDRDAARELLARLGMLPTPARWWNGPAASCASP